MSDSDGESFSGLIQTLEDPDNNNESSVSLPPTQTTSTSSSEVDQRCFPIEARTTLPVRKSATRDADDDPDRRGLIYPELKDAARLEADLHIRRAKFSDNNRVVEQADLDNKSQ
jgi:hypothetical protein